MDSQPPGDDPFAPIDGNASQPDGADHRDPPEIWEPKPITGEPITADLIRHYRYGTASCRWVYRDENGRPLFLTVRFEQSDGDKVILPYCYGRRVWTIKEGPNAGKRRDLTGSHFKAPRDPRPLYGLDRLAAAPDAPVLLVEGEKAADAAGLLFPDMVAITSQGGSHAASRADWDALAGRNVVIWPDNDQAGLDYAVAAAGELLNQEMPPLRPASVRQVAVPAKWGEGWDLADASTDFAPMLREMIEAAEPVSPEDAAIEGVPSAYTDEGLALRFSNKHANGLRYVAGWGKWMQWTGTHWQPDDTKHVWHHSRTICRRASAECAELTDNQKVAANIASAKTVAAVERLAQADRRHAATVGQWDLDAWVLNTPKGVVDLRTGKLGRHDPDVHMTKITAVAPEGECPMWDAFLDTVTAYDDKLIAYLQRVAGYCLTGSIREHALFFAFGTGANGKGVFINTLTGVLNTYATVASIDAFTASQSDRHPTDLAMLRGARLVTAQETDEGRRWAEAKIKAMTGGDPITARFMRQDFFTFQPIFKLLIAGNHRPGLRNVDEAIRRRFNMIPFAIRIAPEKRDKDLPEKLKAEWPGILAWAIRGCLAWQEIGLAPPKAVIDATAEYLEAEDALAAWLAECCITHGTLHCSASDLYASWREWADAAGEHAGSQKSFSQKLVSKGFDPQRLPGGKRGFLGLGLQPQQQQSSRYGRDD